MNRIRHGDPRTHPPSRPLRGLGRHRGSVNLAPLRQRRSVSGRYLDAEPTEVVLEIRTLDGEEGERLARQQARVLWEVTEWLARNKSERGQGQAG